MSIAPDFSYEPFSREPEYVHVNDLFMGSLGLRNGDRGLDLACGTGTLTSMILDAVSAEREPAAGRSRIRVIGVDLSRDALLLARRFLADGGYAPLTAGHVQAGADALPLADASMDAVIIGNAIQLIENKEALVRDVSRVLRSRGRFAFNTSFYAGAYVPTTERFYHRWMEEALQYIKRADQERRSAGRPGIVRRKGLVRPAFSNRWLSALEYARLLGRFGLSVQHTEERTVMLNRRCFESIGSYAGLAGVLLSGYPIDVACEALAAGTQAALDAAGVEAIPRRWLEMMAVKP
jgi:ubiquinone/menaquinone biosynthesis C-methylase UbiE